MKARLACVVGARPNFVKIAPVLAGLRRVAPQIEPLLVHTGQHYDEALNERFFEQLGIPAPDAHLGVGSGSHGAQTARVLESFERWLVGQDRPPAATLVVGDVNSTMAATLAAVKLEVPVIHVEAGLRSHDRRMPEEINRLVTDALAELLLASEPSGVENLIREGRPPAAIKLVGNVMIDVLFGRLEAARALAFWKRLGLEPGAYSLWTVHRPSNVDREETLEPLVAALERIGAERTAVFPVHPRTRASLERCGLLERLERASGVIVSEPLGYLEFLSLTTAAGVVVTDSGGVQEETTALEIPCLTLRENTERPITVDEGTNTLVGHDLVRLEQLLADVWAGRYKRGQRPELWDGQAGARVAAEVAAFLEAGP